MVSLLPECDPSGRCECHTGAPPCGSTKWATLTTSGPSPSGRISMDFLGDLGLSQTASKSLITAHVTCDQLYKSNLYIFVMWSIFSVIKERPHRCVTGLLPAGGVRTRAAADRQGVSNHCKKRFDVCRVLQNLPWPTSQAHGKQFFCRVSPKKYTQNIEHTVNPCFDVFFILAHDKIIN